MKNKKNDDLSGFEEFIEFTKLIIEEDKDGPSSGKDKQDSYDLFNFLDREVIRQKKWLSLFSERTPFLNEHPTGDQLIKEFRGHVQKLEDELTKLMINEKSPVHRNLKTLYKVNFGK